MPKRAGLPRLLTAATAAAALLCAGPSQAADVSLRGKVVAAFASVHSYKVTVLGSVRSLGVWQAPNSYQMTTEFDGKTVKTVIAGKDLYQYENGKWSKSGTASNNLDVDIAGLIRTVKANPKSALTKLPDATMDGKRVGTFVYHFANGTDDTCNYDLRTYLVSRCKADELTLLYSGYNDPQNKVAKVR